MKVKDLMSSKVYLVNIDTPLKEIVNELSVEDNPGFIIVINNNDDIAGIITVSDLFRFIFPDYNEILEHREYLFDAFSISLRTNALENIPAKFIMTKFPEVIHTNAPVLEAAAVMKVFKIKQLPVVEHGKIVGVINAFNIFNNFLSSKTIYNNN